jgi:hypothetical protein
VSGGHGRPGPPRRGGGRAEAVPRARPLRAGVVSPHGDPARAPGLVLAGPLAAVPGGVSSGRVVELVGPSGGGPYGRWALRAVGPTGGGPYGRWALRERLPGCRAGVRTPVAGCRRGNRAGPSTARRGRPGPGSRRGEEEDVPEAPELTPVAGTGVDDVDAGPAGHDVEVVPAVLPPVLRHPVPHAPLAVPAGGVEFQGQRTAEAGVAVASPAWIDAPAMRQSGDELLRRRLGSTGPDHRHRGSAVQRGGRGVEVRRLPAPRCGRSPTWPETCAGEVRTAGLEGVPLVGCDRSRVGGPGREPPGLCAAAVPVATSVTATAAVPATTAGTRRRSRARTEFLIELAATSVLPTTLDYSRHRGPVEPSASGVPSSGRTPGRQGDEQAPGGDRGLPDTLQTDVTHENYLPLPGWRRCQPRNTTLRRGDRLRKFLCGDPLRDGGSAVRTPRRLRKALTGGDGRRRPRCCWCRRAPGWSPGR